MDVRAEVTEADEHLRARVLEGHPLPGPFLGDEHLVAGDLAVPDVDRAIEVELADGPPALGDDQAEGPVVLEGDRTAGIDRELSGAEEVLAVDLAVDDPLVD